MENLEIITSNRKFKLEKNTTDEFFSNFNDRVLYILDYNFRSLEETIDGILPYIEGNVCQYESKINFILSGKEYEYEILRDRTDIYLKRNELIINLGIYR